MIEQPSTNYPNNTPRPNTSDRTGTNRFPQNGINSAESAWLNVSGDIDDFIFYDNYTTVSDR